MLPRHQLMPRVEPVSNLPSQTSQPFVTEILDFGFWILSSSVEKSSIRFAFPGSIKIGTRDASCDCAPLPSRSASCAAKRLSGVAEVLELRQTPLPANSPHEPNAQFCAPGGLSQEIFAAMQFHKTEFAADQPAPSSSPSRFIKLKPPPSIRTLSKSVPLAQL